MGGRIVDATVVAALKQRNTEDEKQVPREGRIPKDWARKPAKLQQKDRDAPWTVKQGKAKTGPAGAPRLVFALPVCGDKNQGGIDRRHGLIRTCSTGRTPPARSGQIAPVAPLVRATVATPYRSAKNGAHPAEAGFASRIHRRKPKGKPMPKRTARANAAKSEARSRGEHVFARRKGPMGLVVRTSGLARARVKVRLANLVCNMRRMAWLAGAASA